MRRAFELNGALSSFSSRIDFAYLLGFLPKNARADLHKLRGIRNKFAHESGVLTFETENIASICRTLCFDAIKPEAPPRSKFTRAVMTLLAHIEILLYETAHFAMPPDADVSTKRVGFRQIRGLWKELGLGDYPLDDHHHDDVTSA